MFNKHNYEQSYSEIFAVYESCNSCSSITSENLPILYSKCCGTILCNKCFTKHYKTLKTKYKCIYCNSELTTEDFSSTPYALNLLEAFSFRRKQVREVLNKTSLDFVNFEDYQEYCILREHYICWLSTCTQGERFKSDKILYGIKKEQNKEIGFRERNVVKDHLDEIGKRKEVRKRIHNVITNFKIASSTGFGNNVDNSKRTKTMNVKGGDKRIMLNCEDIEWRLFRENLFKF